MKSLDEMLKQCAGLLRDTKDVTAWEAGFLTNVITIVEYRGTTALTANQAEALERIYKQHFA